MRSLLLLLLLLCHGRAQEEAVTVAGQPALVESAEGRWVGAGAADPPWLSAVQARWRESWANSSSSPAERAVLLHARSENRTEKIGYVKARRERAALRRRRRRAPVSRAPVSSSPAQTHKTGSTTLGAALYRFGARHGKRFYCQGGGPQPCKRAHILAPTRPTHQVFDMQLNHLSGNGLLKRPFAPVLAWYTRMLGVAPVPASLLASTQPQWALVTPVREPVSHYLSWYYYFGEPDSHMSVEGWVRTGIGANVLASEFGITTEAELAVFTQSLVWGANAGMGGALQLWLPVERFEEAMLLLRWTLRWELLDISYAVLFDSRAEGARRWDGKAIKPTPKLASLKPELIQAIRELNHLDDLLYSAALTAFEVALAAARGEPGSPERSAWEDDATEFAAMQRALLLSFEGEGEACGQLKRWYALADTEYEGEIGREGHGVTPPAAEKEAMLRAYAASGKTRFC